jgi:hypothetical protein
VASEWLERMRSVGYLPRGRTQAHVREGRAHPDSGEPYKGTRDERGNIVTEHGQPGSGVSDRQDVRIHAQPVQGGGEACSGEGP